jgi:hypothetical protein
MAEGDGTVRPCEAIYEGLRRSICRLLEVEREGDLIAKVVSRLEGLEESF